MKNIDNKLTLKIASKVLPHRKRSERMVGFIQYDLEFEIRKYLGESQKSEKIGIFHKTITSLIAQGVNRAHLIGKYMGLDVADELEQTILVKGIQECRSKFQLIQSEQSLLSLTDKGINFINQGEYVNTYKHSFDLFVDIKHPYFSDLKRCLSENTFIKTNKKKITNENLSLSEIKSICRVQASHMEQEEEGISLKNAQLIECSGAFISLYVCFIQSVRDNSIRTIIYNNNTESVIEELSLLFDNDNELKNDLLKKCLEKDVFSQEAEKVKLAEKPKEQFTAEQKMIADADKIGDKISTIEVLNKEAGSIFDSIEFEQELIYIFEKHQNDEIWLISPWIKNYAFINSREPMIRKFLDQGGAIFVGFSKPERAGAEMVDPKSMSMVKRLDETYDRFYYAELPVFHLKNVIEYKNGKTSLYSGSFNILSFYIDEKTEHYRKEQMMVANLVEAENSRKEYLSLFAERYSKIYFDKINNQNNENKLNIAKLNYFNKIKHTNDIFVKVQEKAKEKDISLISTSINDLSSEQLFEIAKKVISQPYEADPYYVQSLLSAYLFIFLYGKNMNNNYLIKDITDRLFKLFSKNGFFKICRVTMSKGKIDARRTIIYIICNNLNFEFGEIELNKKVFDILYKHKEMIKFRDENITLANSKINQILFNSARSVNYI